MDGTLVIALETSLHLREFRLKRVCNKLNLMLLSCEKLKPQHLFPLSKKHVTSPCSFYAKVCLTASCTHDFTLVDFNISTLEVSHLRVGLSSLG
jgi:hypothetical protein